MADGNADLFARLSLSRCHCVHVALRAANTKTHEGHEKHEERIQSLSSCLRAFVTFVIAPKGAVILSPD